MTGKKFSDMSKPELLLTLQECESEISTIKETYDRVIQVRGFLDDGFLGEIGAARNDGVQKYKEIIGFHKTALVRDAENKSMTADLEKTVAQIKEVKKEMLGSPEDGIASGYIDEIKKEFKEHQEFYAELYQKIEAELLSGATTVSLAKNFSDKVEEYRKSRKMWERAISGLFVAVGIGLPVLYLFIPTPSNIEKLIYDGLRFLPLIGFVVWATVFMGNRRAESRKLEEAYKHKEVMARSFAGYKEFIKELDADDKSLLTRHMNNLLIAIEKDSSGFLSTKGERHPLTDLAKSIKPGISKPDA